MNDDEFDAFLAAANRELRAKQEWLQAQHGLGSHRRWWYDPATGKLQFFDADDTLALQADIVHIGSFSSTSNTWQWAWNNASILPDLRQRSEKLKELAALTGLAMFAQEQAFSVADPAMAWELAALSVKHLDALGCYRAPHPKDERAAFFAITAIDGAPSGR